MIILGAAVLIVYTLVLFLLILKGVNADSSPVAFVYLVLTLIWVVMVPAVAMQFGAL